uniref:Uncharacterized protein n=1 Tax=Parastrongyloides trichosuri TaxID=131310 RepID=A0A0N4ZL89_PARTI
MANNIPNEPMKSKRKVVPSKRQQKKAKDVSSGKKGLPKVPTPQEQKSCGKPNISSKESETQHEPGSSNLVTTEAFEFRNARTQQQRERINKYDLKESSKVTGKEADRVMKKQKSFPSISEVISGDGASRMKGVSKKKSKKRNNTMQSTKKSLSSQDMELSKTQNNGEDVLMSFRNSTASNNKRTIMSKIAKTHDETQTLGTTQEEN